MNSSRTALVIGSTGLIGGFVVAGLLANSNYSRVKIFVRRKLDIEHHKLEQHVIDFDKLEEYADLINGDDLFCCIGTTMKNAGSKEAFYKVDYTYAVSFASIAARNKVSQLLLISSLGAASRSSNFYLKVKGEVEDAVKELGFSSIIIFRPSMLLGPRKEFRLGEMIGKMMMRAFFFFFIGTLRKYRAIHAETVALAMGRLALAGNNGVRVVESNEIKN